MKQFIETKAMEKPKLIVTSLEWADESGCGSGCGWTERRIPYGRIDSLLSYDWDYTRKCKLEEQGYVLNERNFRNIRELFADFYKMFKFPYEDNDGVYIGAESCNASSPLEEILKKKCNLTFFGNLEAQLGGKDVIVMACSMGHFHPLDLPLQEIYEFQGYGVMVIERKEGDRRNIDFIVLSPRDKVAVPGNCNMTIYSLQSEPLETHDFANPRQNPSNKDLQKKLGPIFRVYYSFQEKRIFFDLNPKYSENPAQTPIPICIDIPEIENLGKTVFSQAREKSLRDKFAQIGANLLTCGETKIPSIFQRRKLEHVVEEKSEGFLNLFNIKK